MMTCRSYYVSPMFRMLLLRALLLLLLWSSSISSFQEFQLHRLQKQNNVVLKSSFSGSNRNNNNNNNNNSNNINNKAGPTFPSSFTPQQPAKPLSSPQNQSSDRKENDKNNTPAEIKNGTEIEALESDDHSSGLLRVVEGQTSVRFSKYAPTDCLELDATEFRLQLRENMKADLERRRNEDPNRGNQISKNYLDSL